MVMKKITLTCCALLLAACQAHHNPPTSNMNNTHMNNNVQMNNNSMYNPQAASSQNSMTSMSSTQRYKCRNGMDVVLSGQGANIMINYGYSQDEGSRTKLVLNRASAASGVRYVASNGVTQWQEKNGEAYLKMVDKYNNVFDTTCQKSN